MITAEEFKNAWTLDGDHLNPITVERLEDLGLSQTIVDFFSNHGLPGSAAPFLSFVHDTGDLYEGINRLSEQYEFLEPGHEKLIVIGSDGNGNPLAIDTDDEEKIVWLDHENEFTPAFMNSSLLALAEMILIYKQFVKQVLAENGDKAFIESKFTDTQVNEFKQKLMAADAAAFNENCFWKLELDMLMTNHQQNSVKDESPLPDAG